MSPDLTAVQGMPAFQFKSEQCHHGGSGTHDVSPALQWSAGPAGTMSYAVSMYDMTNMGVHFVIYDIPATVTMLPGGLSINSATVMQVPGAKQTTFGGQFGFFGPGATCHAYRLEVWALKVANLPITGNPDRTAIRRTTLPANVVSKTSRALIDIRGQNSGAACGPLNYTPSFP
jgi:phosphatidylethanolamine-binding protein (PEBP) family uncharacterized protein